jgi:hypothetical protein
VWWKGSFCGIELTQVLNGMHWNGTGMLPEAPTPSGTTPKHLQMRFLFVSVLSKCEAGGQVTEVCWGVQPIRAALGLEKGKCVPGNQIDSARARV